MKARPDNAVQSPIGEKFLDSTGSAVGAARMDPDDAYGAVPMLLKEYINNGSERAWQDIRRLIDNTFVAVSGALEALDAEVPFSGEVKNRIGAGQKLFFKPNLVTLPTIDFQTHGPLLIGSCTPWEFLAALMRWFHDKLDIPYHMMSVGEGGTGTSLAALTATRLFKTAVTTQALMEGKYGDNYGGWGFYFVRKYLAECHDGSHTDDPMKGYEDSLKGACLPPGRAGDRLLVYDINKIADDGSDGREVPVADGVNYKSIVLHKAVIGGDPDDPEDIRDWPGCVLINVPKLKIHQLELLTCALKNLGVGLYPMESNESAEPGKVRWRYALPHLANPSFKVTLPHRRWVIETDEETGLPVRGGDGKYVMTETGGMEATIADAVQAVKGQGIMMLHVVDAIETANIAHTGPDCTPVAEGLVFASADLVAVDELSARYLFSTVPVSEVEQTARENKLSSDVIQKIPLPVIEGDNIATGPGFDSPYQRYHALKYCEERGLGSRKFYVAGKDLRQGGILASLEQRLGRLDGGVFTELLTANTYYTEMSLLWYFQKACLEYLDINDRLTGSGFKRQLLEAYDENNDGVVDYLERGKGTLYGVMPYGARLAVLDIAPAEVMRLRFLIGAIPLRLLKREWNKHGHAIGGEELVANSIAQAFKMSKADSENPDLFFPGMTWGKGKWPSLQYAMHRHLCRGIYGQMFPDRFDLLMAPYGQAFRYADARWNGGQYCTAEALNRNEDVIGKYYRAAQDGAALLPFVFYVPEGFANSGDLRLLNVRETDDPELIFSASFNEEETWQDLKLSDIP